MKVYVSTVSTERLHETELWMKLVGCGFSLSSPAEQTVASRFSAMRRADIVVVPESTDLDPSQELCLSAGLNKPSIVFRSVLDPTFEEMSHLIPVSSIEEAVAAANNWRMTVEFTGSMKTATVYAATQDLGYLVSVFDAVRGAIPQVEGRNCSGVLLFKAAYARLVNNRLNPLSLVAFVDGAQTIALAATSPEALVARLSEHVKMYIDRIEAPDEDESKTEVTTTSGDKRSP